VPRRGGRTRGGGEPGLAGGGADGPDQPAPGSWPGGGESGRFCTTWMTGAGELAERSAMARAAAHPRRVQPRGC